ncbi:helix-turn-helix domain-containing protein [Streptomyces sp. NPDC020965]|uniref:nSTAND1 domain-containing NTPase n=1 Tax=Streptomyces sp. NPDC020965 TaxID=3365105 RepID=UPI0037AD5332
MGRREVPVDPMAGPVQRFAYELRRLREGAGGPTYRAMARGVSYSAVTLSRAAAGEQLPSLEVTLAYVEACGGDPGEWERRWHETVAAIAEQSPTLDDVGESPYQGLARFEPADHDRFFGRARLVTAVTELARENRFAAVFGPSGSGKSSLLRAGLVPALRQDGRGLAAIRILTPGEHPLRTHATALTPKETGTDGTPQGDTLLLVDQFEEVFTLCTDPTERAAFIDRLLTAQNPDSRLRVIIAVRADFYSRCAEHRDLADTVSEAALLVGPMTPAELRETIIGPAQGAGLIVEREVTARLISEVEGEPGGLPLLSHVLRETWRRRRGRTLTMAAYEAAGGTHGAIARTAEDIFAGFSDQRQQLARLVLLRLITPGDGSQDTRRPVTRSELDFGDRAETLLVVDRLAHARLLTLDDDTIDLAHEALITAWPRLNAWIEEGRERIRAHRHLTEAAQAWNDLGRDPGALYRGTRLTTAQEHFAPSGRAADLTPSEQAFLTASHTALTRDTHRRRTLLTTLTLVMALALIAGVIAWQQNTTSGRRHAEVEARRITTVAQAMRHTDPKRAMRLSVAAWRLADTTETRSALLGAMTQHEDEALNVPERDATDRGLIKGSKLRLTADGRTLVSVQRDRIKTWDLRDPSRARTYPGPGKPFDPRYELAANGRILVFPREGDGVTLWDVRAGRARGQLPLEAVTGLALSRNEASLAAVNGALDVVEVWEMKSRRRVLTVPIPNHESHDSPDMTLSPDGSRLALCTGDGPPEFWDVARGKRLAMPWAKQMGKTYLCSSKSFAIAPDNRTVAFATDDGIRRWDLGSGRELARLNSQKPESIRFSEDAAYLMATGNDELLVWRLTFAEAPVFRHALEDEPLGDFALDVADGSLRYKYWDEATVRSLSLGRVTTNQWTKKGPTGGQLAEDGRTLAQVTYTGSEKGFRLLDTRDGRTVGEPPGEPCPPANRPARKQPPADCFGRSAFSADGRFFAYWDVGSERLAVWDVTARREHTRVRPTPGKEDPVRVESFALSADGHRLYIAGVVQDTERVEIWDIRDRARSRRVATLPVTEGKALAVRRDGTGLAAPGGAFADLRTRRVEQRIQEYGENEAITFSPNGLYLAVGDNRGQVTVWDGELRKRLATLSSPEEADIVRSSIRDGHDEIQAMQFNGVTALTFSPDGSLLAVGDSSGTVQLWDVASSRPLGSPLPTPGDPVLSLAFDADGHTLYTAGLYAGLETYDIDPPRLAATVCRRAGSGLSPAEWQDHLPDLPYRKTC